LRLTHWKRLLASVTNCLAARERTFALSSSFFTNVRVIGVVGNDFTDAEWDVFKRHNINTDDVEVVKDGKTFFWRGRYDYDLNTAHTLETQLNVFETFEPKPSEESKAARSFFLANICRCCKKKCASKAMTPNSWQWTR
jgi:hypothetical protein